MDKEYDHVLIHAESNPELNGTEIQMSGKGHNVIRMIAFIIANLASTNGINTMDLVIAILAEIPRAMRDCKTHTRIDMDAISKAKEGLGHE